MADAPGDLAALLHAHPAVERVEAFVSDVNGIARGKWLPRAKALELADKGLPLPRSVFALDIEGSDVREAGLAFGTGDPDGLCRPVPGAAAPVPWAAVPSAQVLLAMADADGAPFFADPRAMLARVVDRLAAHGWTAVVATELEFYLLDDAARPRPLGGRDLLSLDALAAAAPFVDAVLAACAVQGVPADTVLREIGPGQFEINLRHRADPVRAADDAVLLKRAVRGVARAQGLHATFMAKPFGAEAGSGMHVHASLRDAAGRPVFAGADGADGAPAPLLGHAVAGLVATIGDAMLAFAPHANSFRRFRRDAHAPMTAGWGLDDRSAAVRVITGAPAAVRLEQRVAGADCNPYLAAAMVLGGMLHGLERALDPGPPQPAAAGGLAGAPVPLEWGAAIARFAASAFVADTIGAAARDLVAACKRQDHAAWLALVPPTEHATYLGRL